MDLKPSSWQLDPLADTAEPDFTEPASQPAGEAQPRNARGPAFRLVSKSEELDYVIARLQSIGLNVGPRIR